MALYSIERTWVGWSEAELQAAEIRVEMCTLRFSGMRWVRSYFDPTAGHSTCIYEAEKEEDVFAHAAMAEVPCDSVRLVEEVVPGALGADGQREPALRSPLWEAVGDIDNGGH